VWSVEEQGRENGKLVRTLEGEGICNRMEHLVQLVYVRIAVPASQLLILSFTSVRHAMSGHGHRVNALALNTHYACRTGSYDHSGHVCKGKRMLSPCMCGQVGKFPSGCSVMVCIPSSLLSHRQTLPKQRLLLSRDTMRFVTMAAKVARCWCHAATTSLCTCGGLRRARSSWRGLWGTSSQSRTWHSRQMAGV
jgi:hypothetical protein